LKTKECNKCKQEVIATSEYFDRDKNCKDGLSRTCKQCMKEYNIKRYQEKKDKIKIQNRTYYENNKEHYKELFEKNSREYYQAHKERYKNRNDKYRVENIEYYRDYFRTYFIDNPDKKIELQTRRRERMDKLPFTLTGEQWRYIKSCFNNCCAYCGKTEEDELKENNRQLAQDHFISVVNGGGYILENMIPACTTCNSSKHDKDFFDWYPNYKYYDKERELQVLDHLEYIEDDWEDYLDYKSGT